MKQNSDSQDSFQNYKNTENEKSTKLKVSIANKIYLKQNDQKQTKKRKTDTFSEMCELILSERKRLFKQKSAEQKAENEEQNNDQLVQGNNQNSQDDLYEIDPHIIHGVVENFQLTTQKDKQLFGLTNIQGKCQHFTLNKTYLIIIIGRLPISYPNLTPISLYLPRSMVQTPPPFISNHFLIQIQRKILNNDQNFLNYPFVIIQPQHLLYPTYLCSWIDCKRRITLVNYISTQYQINQNLVYGSACHRYMEWLIQGKAEIQCKSFNQFKNTAKKIYQSFIYDMYLIDKKTFQEFYQYCEQSLTNIRNWVRNYVLNKRQIQINKYQKVFLVIDQIIGSQTMQRSKYFGLKGKIDCLFKGTLINKSKNTKTQVYIPFQLKTGKKVSQSHKKQTDIYNLLIRQKYKKDVMGLLYYSDSNLTIYREQKVQLVWQNIIIHRNTILINLSKLYKTQKINLATFTSNMSVCKLCNMASACEFLYVSDKLEETVGNKYKNKYQIVGNKAVKSNNNNNQNQKNDIFDQMFGQEQQDQELPSTYNAQTKEKIQKLNSIEVAYLNKWFKWLHYEQRQARIANDKYLKSGFTAFTLKNNQLIKIKNKPTDSKLKFWIIKKMRTSQLLTQILSFYQQSQKLRILINPLNIIQGAKITKISKKQDQQTSNFTFMMQLELNNTNIQINKRYLQYYLNNSLDLDVDLERFQSQGLANLRYTVLKFVMNQDNRLKNLVLNDDEQQDVVGNSQETNKVTSTDCTSNPIISNVIVGDSQGIHDEEGQKQSNKHIPIIVTQNDIDNLNSNQQFAFRKVFSSTFQYCTLVQGMPGTGKTQLIVRLIQKCSQLNWKVLITTFTNRSLDNILQRIFKSKKIQQNKIIRQGSRYSIDQKFEKLNSRVQDFTDVQQYVQYFDKKQFWFVTLASMNIHHIPKQFDLVILDQASQSLEPSCIQALIKGKKIVLIGDYKQLQPIVKSARALKQGMSTSLFQKLCIKYPSKTVSLKLQYRMNKQIMKISNKLVYEDQLQIGNEEVGTKMLKLCQNWQQYCNQQTLKQIISPQNSIIFLNHDGITNSLTQKYRQYKQQIINILQVQISAYLLQKLLQLNIPPSQLSIVCVYNKTVDQLTKLLKQSNSYQKYQKSSSGQILTIDKSQGIDKQVIILITENKQKNNVLLENCRRLNVALTRAKSKLIVIGSKEFLGEMEVWGGGLSQILGKYQYQIKKVFINHVIKEFQNNIIENNNNNTMGECQGEYDQDDNEDNNNQIENNN